MNDNENELETNPEPPLEPVMTWLELELIEAKGELEGVWYYATDGLAHYIGEVEELTGDIMDATIAEIEAALTKVVDAETKAERTVKDAIDFETSKTNEEIIEEQRRIFRELEEAAAAIAEASGDVTKGLQLNVDQLIGEAADKLGETKEDILNWWNEQMEKVDDATSLGWGWLAARIEDLLTIPAVALLNILCDYFFSEETS